MGSRDNADLKRFEEYLDYKSKLSKIDSLLLFCSSSASFIFSVLQVILRGPLSLIYFFPAVLLLIILPVYIGYWRGAILTDSPLERVRGWVYFISSLFLYPAYILWQFLERPLTQTLLSRILYYVFPILVGGLSIAFQNTFAYKLLNMLKHEINRIVRKVLDYTREASLFLVWFLMWIFQYLTTFDLGLLMIGIVIAPLSMAGFVRFEFEARDIVTKINDIKNYRSRFSNAKRVQIGKLLAMLGMLIFVSSLLWSFQVAMLAFFIGSALSILGVSLIILSVDLR